MKLIREPCCIVFMDAGWGRIFTRLLILPWALAAVFTVSVQPASATQVHIPDGTFVSLKLHFDLTTENVEKKDRIQLDVAENVVINNHVVIARGSVAEAKVLDVKGAGKKRPKDGEVDFLLQRVRAVDNQWIPIRFRPKAAKKGDEKSQEIVEDRPIPGLIERMFGAPKGKDYPAYIDADIEINAPDAPPGADSLAQPVQPTAGAPTAAVSAPAPPMTSAVMIGPEPGTVDFKSDPPGMEIFVDGAYAGITPSTLRIDSGLHAVELRKAGFTTWTRKMVVGPSAHPAVRVTLQK